MGATDTPESLTGRVNATFRRRLPAIDVKLVPVQAGPTHVDLDEADRVAVQLGRDQMNSRVISRLTMGNAVCSSGMMRLANFSWSSVAAMSSSSA